jgi:hypothetical protein
VAVRGGGEGVLLARMSRERFWRGLSGSSGGGGQEVTDYGA